jgi:hypothetical protein
MSKAQRRILKSAEEFIGTREKESERIKKAIGQRFFCANLDEQHAVIAPRFVRGKGTQPPVAEELYGKAYTVGQLTELVADRLFTRERLEAALSPGYVTHEDLREHLEDFFEDIEQTKAAWLEDEHKKIGADWDDVNRFERSRRQKALEEEWRT